MLDKSDTTKDQGHIKASVAESNENQDKSDPKEASTKKPESETGAAPASKAPGVPVMTEKTRDSANASSGNPATGKITLKGERRDLKDSPQSLKQGEEVEEATLAQNTEALNRKRPRDQSNVKHFEIRQEDLKSEGPIPFGCSSCEKVVYSIAEIVEHASTAHVPVSRPFRCNSCNKCFGQPVDLGRHYHNFHLKLKRFGCTGCDQRFTRLVDVQVHIDAVHNAVRRHRCDQCSKTFGRAGDLRLHVKTVHEGVRPFKCDKCPMEFGYRNNLKKHVDNVHRGIKLFRCEVCGKRFGRKDHLHRHSENKVCIDDQKTKLAVQQVSGGGGTNLHLNMSAMSNLGSAAAAAAGHPGAIAGIDPNMAAGHGMQGVPFLPFPYHNMPTPFGAMVASTRDGLPMQNFRDFQHQQHQQQSHQFELQQQQQQRLLNPLYLVPNLGQLGLGIPGSTSGAGAGGAAGGAAGPGSGAGNGNGNGGGPGAGAGAGAGAGGTGGHGTGPGPTPTPGSSGPGGPSNPGAPSNAVPPTATAGHPGQNAEATPHDMDYSNPGLGRVQGSQQPQGGYHAGSASSSGAGAPPSVAPSGPGANTGAAGQPMLFRPHNSQGTGAPESSDASSSNGMGNSQKTRNTTQYHDFNATANTNSNSISNANSNADAQQMYFQRLRDPSLDQSNNGRQPGANSNTNA